MNSSKMFKVQKPQLSGSIHSGHFMVSRLDDDEDDDNNDPADDSSESERDNAQSVEIDIHNPDSVADAAKDLELNYPSASKNEQVTSSWNDLDRPLNRLQTKNQYLTYYTNSTASASGLKRPTNSASTSNLNQNHNNPSAATRAETKSQDDHQHHLIDARLNLSIASSPLSPATVALSAATSTAPTASPIMNNAQRSSPMMATNLVISGNSNKNNNNINNKFNSSNNNNNNNISNEKSEPLSTIAILNQHHDKSLNLTTSSIISEPYVAGNFPLDYIQGEAQRHLQGGQLDQLQQEQLLRDHLQMVAASVNNANTQSNSINNHNHHPPHAHQVTIDTSLTKLLQCMSLYYSSKLTSPKWKSFKGLKLRLKYKIRLNNLIWRAWFLQYIRGRRPPGCQFVAPVETDVHKKSETIVLEGKYWKRKEKAILDEYKKWRIFNIHKQKNQLHCFRPVSFLMR